MSYIMYVVVLHHLSKEVQSIRSRQVTVALVDKGGELSCLVVTKYTLEGNLYFYIIFGDVSVKFLSA